MGTIASQITSLTIVYSIVYSDADQRKYQSSASLAFVRGIHRGPVNSPHKWSVTRKMFPFDDVIMDTVHQTSQKESVGWPADSPRDVSVSRNYTVLLFSRDVKSTKLNQYLPVVLTSLNVTDSRFRKSLMLWMRRHRDIALWHHDGGAWYNDLIPNDS